MKRSISRPLVGLPSPSSPMTTEGSISCAICQATYAPSRIHAHLLQAPPIALESVFISMCHFCFRCRRPSCPNCWDSLHSICGQCAHETHLPFRMPTPPLEGTTLLSARPNFSAEDHSLLPSLVPIQQGRFQQPSPPHPTQSAGTIVTSSTRHPSPDIDAIATRPERSKPLDVDEVATRPTHSNRRQPKFIRILLSSICLIIALLLTVIVVALLVGNVNLSMYTLLHIDIRAELTALWHFLQSLF